MTLTLVPAGDGKSAAGDVDNTFFTPWHAVLYSGYGATAGVLLAALMRNHAAGQPWRRALPDGYGLSLLGALIFALAGVGDMVWHTLFGVEVSTAALLSPTHLLLALGGALMTSGPLRAAWRANSSRPHLVTRRSHSGDGAARPGAQIDEVGIVRHRHARACHPRLRSSGR
jgi:hypothetical protein